MEINATNAADVAQIAKRFLEPFDPSEVKVKPAMVKGNRALVLHYIDARVVQDKLDAVVGLANWQDVYTLLPTGEVECRLSVRIAGEWITKVDVGGQSEQPDDGDKMKAAYSDALKRAAVKFGIGRYLYRMPQQWMDYDPVKKQIVRAKAPEKQQPQQQKPAEKPQPKVEEPKPQGAPASGQELHRRLQDYDAKLAQQGLCQRGALLAYVVQVGVKSGYPANMNDWPASACALAVDVVKEFEATMRKPKQPAPAEAK